MYFYVVFIIKENVVSIVSTRAISSSNLSEYEQMQIRGKKTKVRTSLSHENEETYLDISSNGTGPK